MATASSSTSTPVHGFQPKVIFIKRKPNLGFGFTARHFIAYPPWDSPELCNGRAMETIFIKDVHLNGPAHLAGLQTGDRILSVNDELIAGVPYSTVIQRIKQTPNLLKLEVVSKECDVLQMYYTDIAHTPESNVNRDANNFSLINYVPIKHSSRSSCNNNSVSIINNRKILSFPTIATKTPTAMATITPIQNQNISHLDTRKTLKINDKLSMGALSFNAPLQTTQFGTVNNDFIARIRKSIEQKEEFLKAVAVPQHNSYFKSFKTSDNPKRMITGDKVNNYYALNSMGYSENPKGREEEYEYDEDDIESAVDKDFRMYNNRRKQGDYATVAAVPSTVTMKDVHYFNEPNFYRESNDLKKDTKLHKTLERYKPVSPLTLGIPVSEPLSLIRAPSVLEKNTHQQFERKVEMKSVINPVKETVISGQCKTKNSDTLTSLEKPLQVIRRIKQQQEIDDNGKLMRRISYLRATNNDDESYNPNLEVNKEVLAEVIERDKTSDLQQKTTNLLSSKTDDSTKSIITGDMEIKSSSIFGKRLTEYRSWKHVKVELKGDILKIYTGRNKFDTNLIELNLKNYELSEDVTSRRKFVFKLQSIATLSITQNQKQQNAQNSNLTTIISDGSSFSCSTQFTEIYFKTENYNEMKKWIELLRSQTIKRKDSTELSISSSSTVATVAKVLPEVNDQGKQMAEPQKTAATSSVSTSEYPDESIESEDDYKQPTAVAVVTPLIHTPPAGSIESKQDNQGESSSSNSVCSPVIKTRKSEKTTDKDLGSPKSKNWRGLLFRKGGGNSNAAGVQITRNGGSIGFPLKSCPMSKSNEYVPCIVDVCTKIVESKGLNIVGIYRIPGNKAAISELSDQVNRSDFIWEKINEDVRWEDVNVVSSLLKLFIRSLPDALLPSTFYNNFIEADKLTGIQKLKEIKYLLDRLPVYSYETLKHIIRHLHRVSENCDVNLMEPKNLAIIFGPSIIRMANETLEQSVKDMKHQCCIVELLVSQYEYFFECGVIPQLENNGPTVNIKNELHQEQQTNLLLGNVQKIERKYNNNNAEKLESVASRFIPHLRRRSQSKRSTINSDTYSGESILSLECKKSNNDQNIEHRASKEEATSLEISISLTDEESSNSRISDSGSMSLTTITDTLDTKLRNLRSTSESQSENELDTPSKQQQQQQKINNLSLRHNIACSTPQQSHAQQQSFVLLENIPFVDESPEKPQSILIPSDGCSRNSNNKAIRNTPTLAVPSTSSALTGGTLPSGSSTMTTNNTNSNNTNQEAFIDKIHQSHFHNHSHSSNNGGVKLKKFNQNGGNGGGGGGDSGNENDNDDTSDSEVSTTSDPKDSIIISPILIERYKKRKNGAYNKLFRSASFNCRNYSASNHNNSHKLGGQVQHSNSAGTGTLSTNLLTKDEKTDINYTKKRQIQNKQNRSIKRRHTVGGPSDYSATITRRTDHSNTTHHSDHHQVLKVGIRIKNVERRN